MANSSPRSAIPLIAVTIGLIFAVLAAVGVMSATSPQYSEEARLSLTPPQIHIPDLPIPTLPILPS